MSERIIDRCPSCGSKSLFIGKGGWLTCGNLSTCKEPGVSRSIDNMIDNMRARIAELDQLRARIAELELLMREAARGEKLKSARIAELEAILDHDTSNAEAIVAKAEARIAELEAQIEPNVGCGHASYDDDCAECRGNDPERYDPVDL